MYCICIVYLLYCVIFFRLSMVLCIIRIMMRAAVLRRVEDLSRAALIEGR